MSLRISSFSRSGLVVVVVRVSVRLWGRFWCWTLRVWRWRRSWKLMKTVFKCCSQLRTDTSSVALQNLKAESPSGGLIKQTNRLKVKPLRSQLHKYRCVRICSMQVVLSGLYLGQGHFCGPLIWLFFYYLFLRRWKWKTGLFCKYLMQHALPYIKNVANWIKGIVHQKISLKCFQTLMSFFSSAKHRRSYFE